MTDRLPRGWKRSDAGVAHWYSEFIDLSVRYGGWDTRWLAWVRMNSEIVYEVGEYTTEYEAAIAAMRFARREIRKALRRLDAALAVKEKRGE